MHDGAIVSAKMQPSLHGWLLAPLVCLAVLLASCADSTGAPKTRVVTEYGLGPDKWATAWLMTRHAAPGAELSVAMPGKPLAAGWAFDVPDATLRRQGNRTAFATVLQEHPSTDPDIAMMAQIVHDIEVNYWSGGETAESPVIEHTYRNLQRKHGRYAVSPECYLAFFDRVHEGLRAKRTEGKALEPEVLQIDCHALAVDRAQGDLVPELPIETVLTEMSHGKSVVFVDVREPDEFAEAHIPGAINVQLRELDAEVVRKLKNTDYVVSYCIKDFRGFEMARSLRDAGVKNAVILDPFGIRGWVAEGLPTAGEKALDESAARERMAVCMADPDACKREADAKAAAQKTAATTSRGRAK